MYTISEHYTPGRMDEALSLLWDNDSLKPIAGGTDLMIKLRREGGQAAYVQVCRLPELQGVEPLPGGGLSIGAACTFAGVAANPLVMRHIPILCEASLSMGGPQIRNVATIGGNICNGAVSADSAATLVALKASLQLVSREETRDIAIQDFYLGPGRVDLRKGELLARILIPKRPPNEGGCYMKYSMRNAMDIATLGVAACCTLTADNRFQALQLAASVVSQTPLRLRSGEAAALGQTASAQTIAHIAKKALADSHARTSWRASKEFREHILEVYCKRAITQAMGRIKG